MVNEELLPQGVLRQIGDKLYEKRKMAALEVEQIVKRLAGAGDTAKISAIIDKLIAEFAFSPQANHRKVCVWGGGGPRTAAAAQETPSGATSAGCRREQGAGHPRLPAPPQTLACLFNPVE